MNREEWLKKECTLRHLDYFLANFPHTQIANVGGAGDEQRLQEAFDLTADIYDLRMGYDMCKHPLPKKYDTIITMNTFEHIIDPYGAAMILTDGLKKGGHLFVTTLWKYDKHDYVTDDGFKVEDYYRFTDTALEHLFPELEKQKCWLDEEGQRDFVRVSYIGKKI